jgi:hypothetical protein
MLLCAPGIGAQMIQWQEIYVNASTGDDATGTGSILAPFASANRALREAWELIAFPPAPPNPPVHPRIMVRYSLVPIAPSSHGGQELSGWQTDAEITAGVTYPAFPIRMIEDVSLVGMKRLEAKNVVSLDEETWGPYSTTACCTTAIRDLSAAAARTPESMAGMCAGYI